MFWSDRFDEFGERCGHPRVLVSGFGAKFVVAAAWVLDEGMTADRD